MPVQELSLHLYVLWQFIMCLKVLLYCVFIATVYCKQSLGDTFSLQENKIRIKLKCSEASQHQKLNVYYSFVWRQTEQTLPGEGLFRSYFPIILTYSRLDAANQQLRVFRA